MGTESSNHAQRLVKSAIGLPLPNGAVPYVIAIGLGEVAIIWAGAIGADDSEVAEVTAAQGLEVVSGAIETHGMEPAPLPVVLHFLGLLVDSGVKAPNGYMELLEAVGTGIQNTAKVVDPLRDEVSDLDRSVLAASRIPASSGVHIEVPAESLALSATEVMSALTSVLEPDEESKKRRVKRIIRSVADNYLMGQTRDQWAVALGVTCWVARKRGDDALADAARATSLGCSNGVVGSMVPFVLTWVERQLAVAAELLMRSKSQ